jgi:hypothetical protein
MRRVNFELLGSFKMKVKLKILQWWQYIQRVPYNNIKIFVSKNIRIQQSLSEMKRVTRIC